MKRILELKEKRARAWDDAKKILDSAGGASLDGEKLAAYEAAEADIALMGREIEALERARAFEAEMSKPERTELFTSVGKQAADEAKGEYERAFDNYLRTNTVVNVMKESSGETGGYLVPDELERTIVDLLEEENIIRKYAHIIQTGTAHSEIPVVATHGTATWYAEGATMTDSADTFGQKTLNAHKLGTLVKVSNELLADNAFNLSEYIAREFARRIGAAEEEGFIAGDGSTIPVTGLLTDAQTGKTLTSSSAITFGDVIDMFYTVKAPYRKNAVWLMNDSTVKAIRSLKDSTGNYIWTPSVRVDEPDLLLNRPVATSAYMPAIAASAKVIAFGDLSYYWIADRQRRTFRRLNERFADEDMIGFIATERVDGKLMLSEAVKTLVMGS